jgi:hypothetical protein
MKSQGRGGLLKGISNKTKVVQLLVERGIAKVQFDEWGVFEVLI